jgi:KDO2-lipid IV(A) lauroyltransferase
MDIVSFINSRLGPMIGLLMGRLLNRDQAYQLADWLARIVATRTNSYTLKAIRANQAVVRGLLYDSTELDQAVHDVIRNAARGYADWYRAVARGPEALTSSVAIEKHLEQSVLESVANNRGLVLAGAHMSSFNILLLALGVKGYPIQALSYANPHGAYLVDNALRQKFGLDITPISMQSLRRAVRRLREGGLVMTGIDRPDDHGENLTFFGHQVQLPVGHARLAISTGANILVGIVKSADDGVYRIDCAPVIEPLSTGDQYRDMIVLAQKVISVVEAYIRSRPSEWLMFFPVWPNLGTAKVEN